MSGASLLRGFVALLFGGVFAWVIFDREADDGETGRQRGLDRLPAVRFFIMTVTPDTSILERMLASSAFGDFIKNYNLALTVLLGIATLSILILLFLNITKLSSSATNEMKRRQATSGILVCLVCLAIMGAIDTIYAILLSFIFRFGG